MVRVVNIRANDGSPDNVRAAELLRQAVTVLGDDLELRETILEESAAELCNRPELVAHFVCEAARTVNAVAQFAARLGPDDATADEVLRGVYATIDETRSPLDPPESDSR